MRTSRGLGPLATKALTLFNFSHFFSTRISNLIKSGIETATELENDDLRLRLRFTPLRCASYFLAWVQDYACR